MTTTMSRGDHPVTLGQLYSVRGDERIPPEARSEYVVHRVWPVSRPACSVRDVSDAVAHLVNDHSGLRTVLSGLGTSEPRQRVLPPGGAPRLRVWETDADPVTTGVAHGRAELGGGFALDEAPGWRWGVVVDRRGHAGSVVVAADHAHADAHAMDMLRDELAEHLGGRGGAASDRTSLVDLAVAQRGLAWRRWLDAAAAYWVRQASVASEPVPTGPCAVLTLQVAGDLTALRGACRAAGVSPHTAFLARLYLPLMRLMGRDTVRVGLVAGNRALPQMRTAIGMMQQLVPVHVVDHPGRRGAQAVRDLAAAALTAYRHGVYCVDDAAVRDLEPGRTWSDWTAIYNYMDKVGEINTPGLDLEATRIDEVMTPITRDTGLYVDVVTRDVGCSVRVSWPAELLDVDAVRGVLDDVRTWVVSAGATDPLT